MIKHGTILECEYTQGSHQLGDGRRSYLTDVRITVQTESGEQLTITDPRVVKDSVRRGGRVSLDVDATGKIFALRSAA